MKKLNNNHGVSLIWAIVTILVVTMASLTLFHTTMNLVSNSNQTKDSEKAEILVLTLSKTVVEEIESEEETSIQAYLKDNINGSWHYVEQGSDPSSNTRIFPANSDALAGIKGSATISMYWISSSDIEANELFDQRVLHVTVSIELNHVRAKKDFEFEYDKDGNSWRYTGVMV